MATFNYDRTLVGGLKLAEHVNATLALIDETETIKALVQEMTKAPNAVTPAAGDLKKMLEVGYAASVIECTVDQSAGASAGNVAVGDRYTGDVTAFVIEVDFQDDQGSQAHMVCKKISGTPVEDELMTASGSTTNTGKIVVGSLVASPGGGNGKYEGEVQFGVEAGAGAGFYDATVAAMDGLTALRDEYVKLFQGG